MYVCLSQCIIRLGLLIIYLTSHLPRFKCGREIKKKTSIWGLRVRVPPPVPAITLPYIGPITDDSIKHITLRNKKTRNADRCVCVCTCVCVCVCVSVMIK